MAHSCISTIRVRLATPLRRPYKKTLSAGKRALAYRRYLFCGLDGRASQRTKAVIERLLDEGGHANQP